MTPDAVDRYAAYWSSLEPATVDGLDAIAAPDFRFVDPFNDIVGRDRVKQMIRHMFGGLDEVSFTVSDTAIGTNAAYIRWTFKAKMRRPKEEIGTDGMTEIHFDSGGLATAHFDHWDSGVQVYARLPIMGPMVRFARRKFFAAKV